MKPKYKIQYTEAGNEPKCLDTYFDDEESALDWAGIWKELALSAEGRVVEVSVVLDPTPPVVDKVAKEISDLEKMAVLLKDISMEAFGKIDEPHRIKIEAVLKRADNLKKQQQSCVMLRFGDTKEIIDALQNIDELDTRTHIVPVLVNILKCIDSLADDVTSIEYHLRSYDPE